MGRTCSTKFAAVDAMRRPEQLAASSMSRTEPARILYFKQTAMRRVLRQQASHDDFSVFFGTAIFPIATVELVDHPPWKKPLVRIDGRELLGVSCHVVCESVGELRRKEEGFEVCR